MCRVTMDHLRLTSIGYHYLKGTVAHIKVTLGHLMVTLGHLRVTLGHLRVTLGHLWVTLGIFFLYAIIRQTQLSFTPK